MFKIYSKEDKISLKVKNQVINYLQKHNYIISNKIYEYIITIGGDGTFIDAIHKEMSKIDKLTFIPLNTGHLGFYTEKYTDFDKIIENLNKCFYDKYNLLACITNNKTYYALNEFSILSISKTIIFDYFIDSEHVQKLRGGGVIVSTTQGSTALSKSYGGSVVYPNTNTFQITEIASVNNNIYRTLDSSIVVGKDTIFNLDVNDKKAVVLNFDNQYNYEISNNIEIKLSNKSVKVMHLKKSTFTKRIKDGFIK